jgi:outer membrane protein OmpA-like peptidoglycan-associated protein/flagellar hook assembly protein FlgD
VSWIFDTIFHELLIPRGPHGTYLVPGIEHRENHGEEVGMKTYILRETALAALVVVAILGCQTAKPALTTPAESAIQVEKSGFSPAGAAGQNSIDISLLYGNGDAIKSWKVELTSNGSTHKSWTGDAKYLPASLTWDGKDDAGTMAPEGTYTAALSIDYASKFQPASAQSKSFVLDITPPKGSIAMNPPQFTPTANGVTEPVTMTISASSALAHMDSWSLDVLDAAGGLVKNWTGQWPDASASWDGTSMNGGGVTPGAVYRAVATVRDEYGNSSKLTSDVAVALLQKGVEAVPAIAPVETVPQKPGEPSIMAQGRGFSPNGDQVADTMTLSLGYGQPSEVKSWKVTVATGGSETQKTWNGDGSTLPDHLVWDGKTDGGDMAPEGTYLATLEVGYGSALAPGTATSASFLLDVTPPTGAITLSSPLFSPIESSDTVTLNVEAASKLAAIDSWTMDIYDPGGNVFRSFSAKWPSRTAVWNGKSARGEMVQSAEDYQVVAKVRDEFGNTGIVKATVPIDILVEKTATGYRILSSRIFFKAFTPNYLDVAPELARQNGTRLDQLAAKLKKFPGYRIRIVGHAVMINWDKPEAGKEEQRAILVPLSTSRAEAVESALVDRGLEKDRFTAEGVGASDQLVPDSDYKDRWQNRRVALFLEKE